MSAVTAPIIEGLQQLKQSENDQGTVELVSKLDIETERPTEVFDPTHQLEEKSTESKKVTKRLISDKQQASLAKARAILAEKRKLNKQLTKAEKQEGIVKSVSDFVPPPTPDMLGQMKDMMDKRFQEWNKTLLDTIKSSANEKAKAMLTGGNLAELGRKETQSVKTPAQPANKLPVIKSSKTVPELTVKQELKRGGIEPNQPAKTKNTFSFGGTVQEHKRVKLDENGVFLF